jgi:DNA-binding Lrp family transcriptional regulator
MTARIADILREVVNDQYGGNQTRAADEWGVSQSHLSNLMNKKSGRGIGLRILLVLHEKTGRSLDDLVGLSTPPEDRVVHQMAKMLEEASRARDSILRAAEAVERAARTPPPPKSLVRETKDAPPHESEKPARRRH